MSDPTVKADVKYETKFLGLLTNRQLMYLGIGCFLAFLTFNILDNPANFLAAGMVMVGTFVFVLNADLLEEGGEVLFSDFMETTMDASIIKDLKLVCFNAGLESKINVLQGEDAINFLEKELAGLQVEFHIYRVKGTPIPEQLTRREERIMKAIEDVKRYDTITRITIRADKKAMGEGQLNKIKEKIKSITGPIS